MKDGLVRAEGLPLVFRAVGAEPLPRGARVRVRVGAIDLLTLDLSSSVIARLDESTSSATDLPEANDASEDEDAAGPLALAVDVAEADAGTDAPPVAESTAA
jgi:exoribonuclease-2